MILVNVQILTLIIASLINKKQILRRFERDVGSSVNSLIVRFLVQRQLLIRRINVLSPCLFALSRRLGGFD